MTMNAHWREAANLSKLIYVGYTKWKIKSSKSFNIQASGKQIRKAGKVRYQYLTLGLGHQLINVGEFICSGAQVFFF